MNKIPDFDPEMIESAKGFAAHIANIEHIIRIEKENIQLRQLLFDSIDAGVESSAGPLIDYLRDNPFDIRKKLLLRKSKWKQNGPNTRNLPRLCGSQTSF